MLDVAINEVVSTLPQINPPLWAIAVLVLTDLTAITAHVAIRQLIRLNAMLWR